MIKAWNVSDVLHRCIYDLGCFYSVKKIGDRISRQKRSQEKIMQMQVLVPVFFKKGTIFMTSVRTVTSEELQRWAGSSFRAVWRRGKWSAAEWQRRRWGTSRRPLDSAAKGTTCQWRNSSTSWAYNRLTWPTVSVPLALILVTSQTSKYKVPTSKLHNYSRRSLISGQQRRTFEKIAKFFNHLLTVLTNWIMQRNE